MMKRILLAATLLLSSSAYAAISGTKVYGVGGTVANGGWPATVDLTGHTPTSGNILVVCQTRNDDAIGLSATTPSGFTAGPTYSDGSAGALSGASFWKKADGAESSISVTWSDTSQPGSYTYVEVPGTDLDVDALGDSGENETNIASATASLSSGSATNSTATGLAIACLSTNNGVDNDVTAWSNGFGEQQETNYASTARGETFLATKVLSSAAAQSTAGTITSDQGYGSILVFNAAGGTCPATCAGGRSARCITDISDASDPDNLLYGLSPAAVANEDTVCYDPSSVLGDTVNVSAAGWPSIASGGSQLTDSFDYCIMDNGAACGTDGTYEVTFQPVITSVTGIGTGQTTGTVTVTPAGPTEGTVYTVVVTKSSYDTYGAPSHAEAAAGQDGNGDAATFADNDPAAAENAFSATGLSAGSTYRGCGAWENEATPPLTATVVCSAEWSTTAAGDTTPDAFSFTDLTGQALGSTITSNSITVAGTDAPAVITISGDPSCVYKINSGAYTALEGSVDSTDTVTLQVTTEGLYSDQFTCEVTIGTKSATWSVTTEDEPGVPGAAGIVRPLVRALVQSLVQPLVGTGD